jgi:hypothetical protein
MSNKQLLQHEGLKKEKFHKPIRNSPTKNYGLRTYIISEDSFSFSCFFSSANKTGVKDKERITHGHAENFRTRFMVPFLIRV